MSQMINEYAKYLTDNRPDSVVLAGFFVLILAVLPETLPRIVISRAMRNSKNTEITIRD